MTTDQIAIFCIIIFTFALFVWGKWRYDIVSIISLCILFVVDMILGGEKSNLIVDTADIFLGFGHPAVITVAAVLIISCALRNSGVVDLISRYIAPLSKNKIVHITTLSGVVAICSAIMNNVGALALMLPVAIKTSLKQKRSPSILLMPLAFASILGGMITMIGTPPNIIISTFRESQLLSLKMQALNDTASDAANYFLIRNINIEELIPSSFGMLDFSPVGFSIAIIGVLFISIIGWRLIPKESHKKPGAGSLFTIDEYITEIRIPDECKFIGLKIGEIEKYTEYRLTIFGTINDEGKVISADSNQVIGESDRYLIKSDPVDLKLMMDEYTLRFTKKMRERINKLKDENTVFKEVLITPGSPLENRGRTYFRRRTSNSVVLMSIARQGEPIQKRLESIKFRIGDVLLLQGDADILEDNIDLLHLLPLQHRDIEVGVFSKVGLSLLIFFSAILSLIMSASR